MFSILPTLFPIPAAIPRKVKMIMTAINGKKGFRFLKPFEIANKTTKIGILFARIACIKNSLVTEKVRILAIKEGKSV